MKDIDITIYPKEGVGNYKFGTPIEEIINSLGQPDEIEDFVDDDFFNSKVIYYNDLELVFFFEGNNNFIFSSLNVENKNAMIYGKKVFDMTEQEVIDLLAENGHNITDITEDTEYGERCISFESLNLDFYFDLNNNLDCLNFGVLVSDDGKIID